LEGHGGGEAASQALAGATPKPPLIDTHCHLDAARFEADRAQVLGRAWEAGLVGMVVPAVSPAGWESLLQLAQGEPRIAVGLGIHPQLLPELPEAEDLGHLERLDGLLRRGGAAAVGECGLDGPSVPGAPMARQLELLRGHLALARAHGLPVLVHCLRAHPDLMQLLKSAPLPEAGVVLHSYSGGAELARFYAQRGCYFSFAGPVTYAGARKPLAAVREVPRDRLLLETDAPDQSPRPHRGGRCEPGYLPLIARAIAQALGVTEEALARLTTKNARRLFPRAFGNESR
jgi:TatD DNase family protein